MREITKIGIQAFCFRQACFHYDIDVFYFQVLPVCPFKYLKVNWLIGITFKCLKLFFTGKQRFLPVCPCKMQRSWRQLNRHPSILHSGHTCFPAHFITFLTQKHKLAPGLLILIITNFAALRSAAAGTQSGKLSTSEGRSATVVVALS